MSPEQFQRVFEAKLAELKRYAAQDLPRHIGKIAVDDFRENFHRGGYMDEELTSWKPSRRIGTTVNAAGAYGTLLSSRNELYNSIRYEVANLKTVVSSGKPYSRIHNEGGIINQTITITPKMRRFAWAKYYEANPDGQGEAGGQWKGLALTKKTAITRTINMPRRQFMGHSFEVKRQIEQRMIKDIKKIMFNKN